MDLDYNDKAVSVFKGTRLDLKIIEKLAFEFAKIDVQALFKMSDAALQNHFSRAGLSFFQRNDAMQAVLKARKSQYTWEGKRIEKKHLPTNRQLAPRIRLPSPPSTPVQRHERGNYQVVRLPPQPEASRTPGHRHLREEYMVIHQPPQPESPRTPVQHYRKPTYSPPPRTPAANNPAYKSAPGPSPEELVAKYARGLRFRQDNVREERRLHNLHQGIGRAY